MGRFSVDEAENYGSSSKNSFFALQNDKDVAQVRILYNGMEDVEGYAVHEVEIDGKKRYVNCLRAYNEPKSKCPFCDVNNFQKARLYIPLFNVDTGEVQIWERGKKFFAKIASLCSRYTNADTPLCANVFEIERNGKKGDKETTYEIYKVSSDDSRLEDFPEVPDVLGTIILDKTAEEMNIFLDEGEFPNRDGAPERSYNNTREEDYGRNRERAREHDDVRGTSDERPTGRRTPANGGRRGDNF